MPKITFFNLPEVKRQLLIHAIKKEFSRVPLYEASIANIIKSAKIPRGSFYQYFEDKEDAFYFLLNELSNEMKKNLFNILEIKKGDLFETMEEFFYMIIKGEDNFFLLRNIFLNMNYKVENTFARSLRGHELNGNYQELSLRVDKTKLNIIDDHELFTAIQIILTVTFRSFVEKFAKELSIEESMDHYKKQLEILKKGLIHKQ